MPNASIQPQRSAPERLRVVRLAEKRWWFRPKPEGETGRNDETAR